MFIELQFLVMFILVIIAGWRLIHIVYKDLLSIYENQDKQRIAAMQLFAGLGSLMERLETKKPKFFWSNLDSKAVVVTMEKEKIRSGTKSEEKETLRMRSEIVGGNDGKKVN